MSPIEIIFWVVFVLTVCLLFFAAFSSDRVSNQTIEEYMESLINSEEYRREP